MSLTRKRIQRAVLGAAFLGMTCAAATAEMADFTLAKALPANVSLVTCSRTHAGLAFVNEQYARVWAAVERAGFERELKRMLKDQHIRLQGAPADFEDSWLAFTDRAAAINVPDLVFGRETAFAARIGMPPEFVWLCLPKEGTTERNYAGLSGMLEHLASMDPQLNFSSGEVSGGELAQLTPAGSPLPLALSVARQGEVIAIGFGTALLEESLVLLNGGEGEALAKSVRFAQAFDSLPPAKDGFTFVDANAIVSQLRSVIAMVAGLAAQGNAANPQAAVPGKILDALDMFDYAASVASTDGLRTESQAVTLIKPEARDNPFFVGLFGNQPLTHPLKGIPAGAANVSVHAGADINKLYEAVVSFIKDDLPDGDTAMLQWEAIQEEVGVDVAGDVLAAFEGGYSYFMVPGATSFSPSEWAFSLHLRDGERAQALLDDLMVQLEAVVAEQQGRVLTTTVQDRYTFRMVEMPMLQMLAMRPTLGIIDDRLYVTSGVSTVVKALDAGQGSGTFAENKRFQKEGLKLADRVVSFSFADTSQSGEQWHQLLKMAPMLGLVAGEAAQAPGFQPLLRLCTKAAPIAREFNFFSSSCSQTTLEGRRLVTQQVTTYRQPGGAAAAAPAESGR